MANRATRLKGVTVEEIAKTSLAEAGIHTVSLPNGTRVVAIANTLWPMHDRNMHVEIMKFLADYQPDLVVLLGHMVNNESFQSLFESEKNYLHRPEHPPEVKAALAAGSFDDQVQYLRREASKYIGSFAVGKATGVPKVGRKSPGRRTRNSQYFTGGCHDHAPWHRLAIPAADGASRWRGAGAGKHPGGFSCCRALRFQCCGV